MPVSAPGVVARDAPTGTPRAVYCEREDRSEARTAAASEHQHREREDRSRTRRRATASYRRVTSGESRPFIQP
jgi:hypothetical protein